jgi:hypothetical protein
VRCPVAWSSGDPVPETDIPVSKKTDGMRAENFFAAADLALTDAAEPLIKGVIDRGAMSSPVVA